MASRKGLTTSGAVLILSSLFAFSLMLSASAPRLRKPGRRHSQLRKMPAKRWIRRCSRPERLTIWQCWAPRASVRLLGGRVQDNNTREIS